MMQFSDGKESQFVSINSRSLRHHCRADMETGNHTLSLNKLYVCGIPQSCSNETLSEVFSKAGAIKDCFVVKYKNSDSKRPCIGYVTYTSPDDARSALRMTEEFVIDGNKLKIAMARKKMSKKEKKQKEKEATQEKEKSSVNVETKNTDKCENKDTVTLSNDALDDDSYTVLVGGLPALYKKEHVLTLWKKCGLKEPKELIFPCENIEEQEESEKQGEESETEAKKLLKHAKFVVETKQAALKAYNKLSGKVVGRKNNYTLKVTFLTPEGNFKAARKSRLIVRNVSFQCSEDDLKKEFSKFGTVTEVKIPAKPDGKKRGFAFVQFTHVFEASRAIKAMNLQEIKGRKVAIDWSLPKEKYKEINLPEEPKETGQEDSVEGREEQLSKEEQDNGEESMSDEETVTDSGVEEEESESNKETSDEMSEDESESNKDTSEDESDEQEDVDGDDNPYLKPLAKASKNVKKLDPKSSHDVHEGRTVFVLNLSYDTTEDTLAEVLAEFGDLCYTKIVINHDTGMSKGCAFAQYKTSDEAKRCMAALGKQGSGRMLDGREIKVDLAVSRGETDKRRKEGKKKKEKEDKKNLYLGREGLVRPGTSAAEGLSEIELKKRVKIENAKRAKLKNPNVFVSTTRLCVHNLPKFVDDKKLRELLLSQFKDSKSVHITECRIMRDRSNLNEKGVGRPLGYAFVAFARHENALKALRSLNNNPDTFGPIKRPIVEFALENKKALEIKEQRRKKFVAKKKLSQKIHSSEENVQKPGKGVKKMGRRQRQNLKRKLDVGDGSEMTEKRAKLAEKTQAATSSKKGQKSEKNAPELSEKRSKLNPHNRKQKSSREPDLKEQRKSYQGSTGTTLGGKKLPMPAHSKPKIRQKNKGKILDQMRRSKKLNTKAAQRKLIEKFKREKFGGDSKFEGNTSSKKENLKRKAPKRKSADKEEVKFDALVAKYTKAIMDKSAKKSGEKKWYE